MLWHLNLNITIHRGEFMDNTRHGGSILQPFLMLVGVFLLIAYLVGALNSDNWLWFLPIQPDYTPSRIVVRDRGESVEYRQGDEGFDELVAALNASLSEFNNRDLVPLGLSDLTLQEYAETAVVIEVYYPQNIRFNTPVRMSDIDQLLIPIEGRHAGLSYVFPGSDGLWLAGAFVMTDDQPLMDVMRSLGHIQ
jgi:hypothetical protein